MVTKKPVRKSALASPGAGGARGGRYRLVMLLALAGEVVLTGLVAVAFILTGELGDIWLDLFGFFFVAVIYTVYAFMVARPLLETARASRTGRVRLLRILAGSALVVGVTGFLVAMIAIWTSGYALHAEVEEGAQSAAVVAGGFALGLMSARFLSPRIMMRVAVPTTLAFLALGVTLSVVRIHNDLEAVERPLVAAWVLAATSFVATLIPSRAERGGWLQRTPQV